MTPMRLIFSLLGLALISACATAPTASEIPGLEAFAAPCTDEPAIFTEAQARALAEAMPSAEQRERDFWAPRDLQHRRTTECERARANGALAAGEAYNQAVRDSD